ncbi:MAG: hypothetical protein AMXMBFR84_11800 [Candidatus Hydrogenedentota bacterium]
MEIRKLLFLFLAVAAPQAFGEMKTGVGISVITPHEDMWMSGYASRKEPSSGKIHDLYGKALAIDDGAGSRVVVVTTDLIGLPSAISDRVAEAAKAKHGIERSGLMLTSSHTHCGPVVRGNLMSMYALDEVQGKKVALYAEFLVEALNKAVDEAIANLRPGELHWGHGHATFAKNRRQYTVGGLVNGINPIGPVDHDVPLLVARNGDGSIKAVLFGYACHNTTLSFQQICGDYAGFAQAYIQENIPGATALFAMGCGADANPQPRGKLELAQQHGTELGKAVLEGLEGELKSISGPIHAAFEETALPLTPPPTREEVEAQLNDKDVYIQRRAQWLLESIDRDGPLKASYPCPVQVWRFGNDLQITALGGEVVVDYALRIKYELGQDNQFVVAYANDVFAYVPSLRILREGGYEGDTSMIYYGLYGPWAPEVEDTLLDAVRRLTKQTGGKLLEQ